MRWKTTTALALLFVALAVFFYVYEVRQGPAREKATAEKDRIFKDLEAKDIEDLRITRGQETVHLKKAGEAWTLVAPVATQAAKPAVDEVLTALATLRREREIEASPAKPADFGLQPPAAEIAFTAKGQSHRVRLGAKSPTGIWVYAQTGESPAVLLVSDSLLRDAQKPVADFRDRSVLAFERKDVKALEIEPPGGPALAAQAKGADEWQVTAPLAVPADREAITGLLEKLRAAKIKDFVTEPPAKGADPYGLARPLALTLRIGEEKDRVAKTLKLGKAIPDRKAVYAQREGDPAVFTVEDELVKAVPTSVTALRDKRILAYDRGKLERLELASPKGQVTLVQQEGAWRISAPVQLKADEGLVNELLWKVRDLRARDFVDEDAGRLARYGLDRPPVRLSVWEKDAKEPKTLRLAPAREKDVAYATAGGPVALVDAKALADLTRDARDLRDHSLFGGFDTQAVVRVAIERPDQTLVVTRRGEDEWDLAAPRKGKARGSRVSDIVWTLRNLKWRDLVAEQGWEPGRYGLDSPATTITLADKDGTTVAALAIGKTEQGATYVRVPGQPALYALEAKSLGDLPATPEDLLL
jgi:hypothetical protein